MTLTLGIDIKSTVLLLLSLFVTAISLGTGRTTVLQGTVLLVDLRDVPLHDDRAVSDRRSQESSTEPACSRMPA